MVAALAKTGGSEAGSEVMVFPAALGLMDQ